MSKIEKLTVSWNGLLPVMTKLVQDWRPPKLPSEANYRDHLFNVIRESVPADTKVEKEYRHRGTTMDLWLAWKGITESDEVAFELKVNLKRKIDFDRLVGQIEGMEPKKYKVIVVLIGDTDSALLGRLKEKYGSLLEGLEQTLSIVLVPV